MTVYAHVIEESNDNAMRKARVNALYDGTAMAARMAASEGKWPQRGEAAAVVEILSLADARNTPHEAAVLSAPVGTSSLFPRDRRVAD